MSCNYCTCGCICCVCVSSSMSCVCVCVSSSMSCVCVCVCVCAYVGCLSFYALLEVWISNFDHSLTMTDNTSTKPSNNYQVPMSSTGPLRIARNIETSRIVIFIECMYLVITTIMVPIGSKQIALWWQNPTFLSFCMHYMSLLCL